MLRANSDFWYLVFSVPIGFSVFFAVFFRTLRAVSQISGIPQLRHTHQVFPVTFTGKNTVDCMKSGLIYGHAGSIDGIIDRINEICGFGRNGKPAAKLVATGGLSKVIIPFCRNEIVTDPALLIRGLKYIYDKNVQ